MTRIDPISETEAAGKVADLYATVKGKLGRVPNMVKTMAVSTPVLEGYLALSAATSRMLDARERELISLAVAEVNGCEYCAAAHTALSKMVGLEEEAILAARAGSGAAPRHEAIAGLARAIAQDRGNITDAQLKEARDNGVTEAEIAEVVANVALSFYTNLINNVARTEIDFPKVGPITCAC